MDSIKNIVRDAATSVIEITHGALRLISIVVPLVLKVTNALVEATGRLLDVVRGIDVGKRADDVRKSARRSSHALARAAREAEARRTAKRRRQERNRKIGVAGAVAAAIAIALFVPRWIMSQLGRGSDTYPNNVQPPPTSTAPTASSPAAPDAEVPPKQPEDVEASSNKKPSPSV